MILKPIQQGDKIIYSTGGYNSWWDRYMNDSEEYEIVKIFTTKRKGLKKYESKIIGITIGPSDKLKDVGYFVKKDNGLKINSISFKKIFKFIPIKGINSKVTIL